MELRRERRDIGDVNPCIATTKSVTSQLASAAHTCRLPLSPIAHHARYQIGQPLEAFREAFAPRGEAYTEMHGHCKAVARRPGARSTPPRAASSQKAREFSVVTCTSSGCTPCISAMASRSAGVPAAGV